MRLDRTSPPDDEPRPRRRVRRWVVRILGAMAAIVGIAVVAVLIALHSLDRAWLKGRIQRIARTSGGVEIDYRTVNLGLLSGIEIDDLVVRSPAEVARFAPDLVTIRQVKAAWHVGAFAGQGPYVDKLTASGVALAVVVDENGRTSFDALSSGPPSAPSAPPTPLSRQASAFLGKAPAVSNVAVEDVALALVRTDHGQVAERTALNGLAVAIDASPAAPAKGWRVKAALGTPPSPLDVRLTRTRGSVQASARAKAWLTADVTSSDVSAALDLRVPEQTFAPSVAADHWLHAEANVHFDPASGRTLVTLTRAAAGDDAASADALVELPDSGDPIVRHAQADLDLARILKWIPAGVVPVTAARARVHAKIEALALGAVPRLAGGGSAVVEGEIANVALDQGTSQVRVGGGKVSIHARPADAEGVAGTGSVQLTGLHVAATGTHLGADDLGLDFDAKQSADGAITGKAGLHVAHLEVEGESPLSAHEAKVNVEVDGLRVDPDRPLAARGGVTLSLAVGALDARSKAAKVGAEGLSLHAHTVLSGQPPYALDLEAAAGRFRLNDARGALLVDAPAELKARVHDVAPDLARPLETRAVAQTSVKLGEASALFEVTKGDDVVDFALHADAPSLHLVRPFLPPDLAKRAPWDRIGVTARSSGRIEHLRGGAPTIKQTTDLEIDRAAFDDVSARKIALSLRSNGSALVHAADIDLHTEALAVGGTAPRDDHVTLNATLDREHLSLAFKLATEGRAATKLGGSFAFDPARKSIVYGMDGHVGALAPLAPFAAKVHGLDAIDLSQLDVGLAAHGAVLGVVSGVTRDGNVVLAPNPAQTAAVEGTTELHVAHFHWAKGDTEISTPAFVWHGDMHAAGDRRTLVSKIDLDSVHLDLGIHDVDLNGVGDEATATVIGSLLDPEVELTQRLSVRGVIQDLVPEYPLGDLSFALTAERSREGMVHISDLDVGNGRGGTTLAVTGNLDLGEGRRTLSVTTTLTQDLAKLSLIPDRFKGSGKTAVEASVTSPDLAHFKVRSAVKGDNVNLVLPRAGVEVETANGEVPITLALLVGANGVALERSEKQSPYSMLRFADQHPLLARSGFLSIARLKTPFVTIAPLVGNLEIEQNVISLRQFEMGVRNGSITGQCGIDWDGARSTLELHVRASGVQSSHGEPFDGNIAVAISAADRTVEGRAEILRIGERHLLDLLDLQDPLHVDPGINRIRTALKFGYPDSLRLVFDHGFASAHLELGGLARLVSIGELRGIPMGPIIDKFLAPVLDGLDQKDTTP